MIRAVREKITGEGVFLFLLRIPVRSYRYFRGLIAARLWGMLFKECGEGLSIGKAVWVAYPKRVVLGDNVRIGDHCVIGAEDVIASEGNAGELLLEDSVQLNANCRIDHTGGVAIGKGSLLSENVSVFTHSHGYDPRSSPTPRGLKIGQDVWIGYGVIITENVDVIESGVIVAAGSVVTKSLDSKKGVYGGVPARLIKDRM